MVCLWHGVIAIVAFHCQKHGIHRTSPAYHCENYEVVHPHNNVKSQKSKGTYKERKERQNDTTAIPTHHSIVLGPMSEKERKARERSKSPQNIHQNQPILAVKNLTNPIDICPKIPLLITHIEIQTYAHLLSCPTPITPQIAQKQT